MHINNRLLKGTDLYQKIGYLDNRFPTIKIMGYTSQVTTTGKNILNALTGRTEKTPSGGVNGTRDFLGNGIYKGFTRNNYYIPNNVSSYSIIDNNNIALSVETGYYGLAFDFIVEPNTDYIVNFTSLNEGVFAGAGFFDEDGNYIDNVSNAKNGFTTPSTCKYVLLCFTKNSTGNILFSDIQLEKGSSSTPFEPYTGGIPAPNPEFPMEITCRTINDLKLYGINSIKDYAYPKDGKWYIKKNIDKVVLNEATGLYTYNNMLGANFANVIPAKDTRATGMCNRSSKVGRYYSQNSIWVGATDRFIYWIGILDVLGLTTLEQFNNWLSSNNTIIYYVLTESYEEEITNKTTIALLEKILSDYIKENQEEIIIN